MVAAPILPRTFDPWRRHSRSRIGWAALFSIILHGLAGVLLIGVVVRAPLTAPPIRVFLYNPPPPPPAAAGVVGPEQPPAHVTAPAPVVEQPTHHARRPVLHRHAAVHPAPAKTAPAAEPAAVPSTATEPGGVPGGTKGGIPGGMVGGTGHSLIPADQAALQPVVLSRVIPEYPPMARLRGIQGQVVLDAILDPDGRVEPNIAVVQSIPLLDGAAIAALRQWRFRPARDRDGTALRVTLRVPVRFVLR